MPEISSYGAVNISAISSVGYINKNDSRYINADWMTVFGDIAYLIGGGNTSSSYLTTSSSFNYFSGICVAGTPTLGTGRQEAAGCSDGVTYGYVSGGLTGAEIATSERLTFSTSTFATHTGSNLSIARGWVKGMSDATYGWRVGGRLQSTNTYYTRSDRITFSTGTSAWDSGSDLAAGKRYHATVSGGTYGYISGGSTNAYVQTNDRLTFSTSTRSSSTTYNMTVAKGLHFGISSYSTYAYYAGGNTNAGISSTDRMTFSTGACAANTVSDLTSAKYYGSGLSDRATYGYAAGGYSTTTTSATDRITFSTGARASATTSALNLARANYSVVSENGNAH